MTPEKTRSRSYYRSKDFRLPSSLRYLFIPVYLLPQEYQNTFKKIYLSFVHFSSHKKARKQLQVGTYIITNKAKNSMNCVMTSVFLRHCVNEAQTRWFSLYFLSTPALQMEPCLSAKEHL